MLEIVRKAVDRTWCVPCRQNAVRCGGSSDCPFPDRCIDFHQAVRGAREAAADVLDLAQNEPVWTLAGFLRDSVEDLRRK